MPELHPIIDLLKRIVIALPDYAGGGGGELPESITAIDGGEFILSSNTQGSNYPITHSLGTTPNLYKIWSDNIQMESTGNNIILQAVFSTIKSSLTTSARDAYVSTYNHDKYLGSANLATSYDSNANDTEIKFDSSLNYLAGITYYWVAIV